jgi:hypothetical protein
MGLLRLLRNDANKDKFGPQRMLISLVSNEM